MNFVTTKKVKESEVLVYLTWPRKMLVSTLNCEKKREGVFAYMADYVSK